MFARILFLLFVVLNYVSVSVKYVELIETDVNPWFLRSGNLKVPGCTS